MGGKPVWMRNGKPDWQFSSPKLSDINFLNFRQMICIAETCNNKD